MVNHPGIEVGLSAGGVDVVRQGVAVGKWASDEGYLIPPNTKQITFTFVLRKTEHGESQVVKLTSTSEYASVSPSDTVTLTTAAAVPVTLTLSCPSSPPPKDIKGALLIEMANFDTITLHFTITMCAPPPLNVQTSTGEQVIQNGQLLKQKLDYYAASETATTKFLLSLSESSLTSSIELLPQVISNSPTVLEASLVDESSSPIQVSTSGSKELEVSYRCVLLDGASSVTLKLDYGGGSVYSFEWDKTCGAGEHVSLDSAAANSRLSAFSVFIVTLVSLLVFACGLGCAYNYFQHDLRGFDMVPGNEYIQSALNHGAEYVHQKRMDAANRYKTPQMQDYDRVAVEDEEFGGNSYQTDL